MSYSVDFFIKARLELFEARLWYDSQEQGLGKRFKEEVFRKIDLIQKNPLHYPFKKRTSGSNYIGISIYYCLKGYQKERDDHYRFCFSHETASQKEKIKPIYLPFLITISQTNPKSF